MSNKDIAEMISISFAILIALGSSLWLYIHYKLGKIYDELKEIRKEKKEEKQRVKLLSWQFCKDPNYINIAIEKQDENWYGLKNVEQIVNVTYDTYHGCYVVFWVYEKEEKHKERN